MNRTKRIWSLLAVTGLLAMGSAQAASPTSAPKHRISLAQARKTALKVYNGKIAEGELEHEHGKWVYSFDIRGRGNDRNIHEVQVDARTGKVVSSTIETPKQEAQEKTAESR